MSVAIYSGNFIEYFKPLLSTEILYKISSHTKHTYLYTTKGKKPDLLEGNCATTYWPYEQGAEISKLQENF